MSKNDTSWDIVLLNDIASEEPNSFVDGPFGSDLKVRDYTETGVRILQLQNLGDGLFFNNNKKYTSKSKANSLARCITYPGDIIIAKMADPLARAAIVPDFDEMCLIVADLIKLKVGKDNDPYFITATINSPYFRNEAERLSTGTTRTRISLSTLKTIPIKRPKLNIQRKIAKILTTVDNLIEKTETLIAKYQSIKQGMMHDLFTRGVDANGQLRPPVDEAPELYKESELGWIPREWDIQSIDSLSDRVGSGVTPTGGSEVYVNDGIIFIRSQNVTFEGLNLEDIAHIDLKTHKTMSASELFPFDILLNITGASIGRCCYLPDNLGLVNSNQHVCCIRLKKSNESDSKFLSYLLSSPFGQTQISKFNAGGNREGLNYQQLRSFKIQWPQNEERTIISKQTFSLNKSIWKEKEHLKKLSLIKCALMQDLLTGKVRVKPDKPEDTKS